MAGKKYVMTKGKAKELHGIVRQMKVPTVKAKTKKMAQPGDNIKRATVKRRRLGRKVFDLTDANPKRVQAAKAFSNQFRAGRGLKRTTNRGRKAANRGGSRR